MKKIIEIITFPFFLIFIIISFPFKIVKIIIEDKIEKKKNNEKTFIKVSQEKLINIADYLFTENKTEFIAFFNSFLKNRKKFLYENRELLTEYGNFELHKIREIEVIYIFGHSKQKLLQTDWRGEEDEREIEYFLKEKLQVKSDWKNVNELRKKFEKREQRDGKFIVELLKNIDKDLESTNKKLIFFNLDWDAYVYGVVDKTSYKTISEKFGTFFH